MTGSELHTAGPSGAPPPRAWRRRQYVVDARYQLRAGVMVGVVAIALLILLNLSLWDRRPLTPSAPRIASTPGPDRTSWALILLGSGVFVAGVMAISVLESHRTAGAAYAIRRSIDALRAGERGVRVKLRRGDHLQDLARAINALAESLDAERPPRG